jgi:polyketide biosynthesis malonyl-CoA-[acyl-carrier-protein] transacylase
MLAITFPGQGSQRKGMGEDLFPRFPDLVRKADDVLGYSVEKLCLQDPFERLNQTQFTQTAMYIVNALSYLAWCDNHSERPSYFIGHSLGEYNALLAAEVFDFETGLKLIMKRGELMSQAQGGAMAAVVGLTEQHIDRILTDYQISNVAIANKNSRKQFVLSGAEPEVMKAKEVCQSEGALLAMRLNVSGAFHSEHMGAAQQEFKDYLSCFKLSVPKTPVLANSTATPYQNCAQEIKSILCDQITHSVLWTESIDYLLKHQVTEFVELGSGNVLTGLINRIKNGQ